MGRRRNEVTTNDVDAAFPHQVKFPVPESGWFRLFGEMREFCRDMPSRSHSAERGQWGHLFWCFETPEHADAFQARYGGARVDRLDLAWKRQWARAKIRQRQGF